MNIKILYLIPLFISCTVKYNHKGQSSVENKLLKAVNCGEATFEKPSNIKLNQIPNLSKYFSDIDVSYEIPDINHQCQVKTNRIDPQITSLKVLVENENPFGHKVIINSKEKISDTTTCYSLSYSFSVDDIQNKITIHSNNLNALSSIYVESMKDKFCN